MHSSSTFFENTHCEFFPCHNGLDDLNCLFCFCPLYGVRDCPGEPRYREKNGREIKVCKDCTFPHRADNYGKVMERLKKEYYS